MERIDLEQGSKEWLNFRHNSIGSSDIPVILGISKYKNRSKLLHEKALDQPQEDKKNPILALGHQAETYIRPIISEQLGCEFVPMVLKNKYLHASLDGIDRHKKIIWECKLTSKIKYAHIENNILPKDFFAQIQFQFLVTKYSRAIITAIHYNHKERKNFNIYVNKEVKINIPFIKKLLIPEIKRFKSDLEKLKHETR